MPIASVTSLRPKIKSVRGFANKIAMGRCHFFKMLSFNLQYVQEAQNYVCSSVYK